MRQAIHEQTTVPAEVIAHEWMLRQTDGEPYVVRPGQVDDYVRGVIERASNLFNAPT